METQKGEEQRMNKTRYSQKWAEIGQSVIKEFAEGKFKAIVEHDISIGYVISEESPQNNGAPKLAECITVKKDHARQFTPHDYLIKLYMPNVLYMTEDQLKILMEYELMHIQAYEDKDGNLQITTRKHDVQDFSDIIERYGIDWTKDMHPQITIDDIAHEPGAGRENNEK